MDLIMNKKIFLLFLPALLISGCEDKAKQLNHPIRIIESITLSVNDVISYDLESLSLNMGHLFMGETPECILYNVQIPNVVKCEYNNFEILSIKGINPGTTYIDLYAKYRSDNTLLNYYTINVTVID